MCRNSTWLNLESRRLAVLFLVCLLPFGGLTGCRFGAALIESEPSGAVITDMADNTYIGTTPCKHWWKSRERRKLIAVRFEKKGYVDKVIAFTINLKHFSEEKAVAEPQPVKVLLEKEE